MKLKMAYEWRLREVMAEHDMWKTTDLRPLLAERGIALSAPQIHRLVTAKPVRMSLDVLVALCDIFGCEPGDLITRQVIDTSLPKTAGDDLGDWTSTRPRRPPPADLGPDT